MSLELKTFQMSLHRETYQGEVNKEQIWLLVVLPGRVQLLLQQKVNPDHLYISTMLLNLMSFLE